MLPGDPQLRQLCNKYQIIDMLGEGSFGVVYLALQKSPRTQVALKCINLDQLIKTETNISIKELKERFLRTQTQIMQSCESENIVKCLEVLESWKWRVLVLQYCPGGSLFDLIQKRGKLPEAQAIEILGQLLMGFGVLHQKKVIHRDLKTENILVNDGVYKIADFGLAKNIGQVTRSMRRTTVGTRITMAPEVQNGQPYDAQADLWSLGVVYYEILTGDVPFNGPVTQKAVGKFHETLENLSISNRSKQFLRSVLRFNLSERLKWLQLYKMYNNRAGVFEGYEPRVRQGQKKGQGIGESPRVVQRQLDQPSKEKVRGQIGDREGRRSEEKSIVDNQAYQKMENNFDIALRIHNNTLKPCSMLLRKHSQMMERDALRFIYYYQLLIVFQICKLIDENQTYLYSQEIEEAIAYDREIAGNNKIILQFNQFNRGMRNQYQILLTKFGQLNQLSRQQKASKFFKIMLCQTVLRSKQIKGLQTTYLQDGCPQYKHIEHTVKSFDRVHCCVDGEKYMCKNPSSKQLLALMKSFMDNEYGKLILTRRKR